MFPPDEIIAQLDLPSEWLDAIWINHSDVPDEYYPNTFRFGDGDKLSCAHNFSWHGPDHENLPPEEGGIWSPILATYNKGFVQWDVDPIDDIRTNKYRIFVFGQLRDVSIGRCPVCGKVHYFVERMPDEWFNLEIPE